MKENIKILKSLIEDLKREEKLIGYNAEVEIQAIENLIKGYRELEKENKKLKASHIMTHNKTSIKEKAKLFDVIDNSIDTYLEQAKPHWEQIMTEEKMTIEEAETVIDDMYQDRNKILIKTGETETEVIFDVAKLDKVQFTNLEFASVRALREIQSLRRKLANSIPKSKVEGKIEELNKNELLCKMNFENIKFTIQVLQELLGDEK